MSRQNPDAAQDPTDAERRQVLRVFSVLAGAGVIAADAVAQTPTPSAPLPPPRRALTGRDTAGKSVFKSFDVTPQVIPIDANPGLTFYELYATEGVPQLTGTEPDPMLRKTKAFPEAGGTNFRLIAYPPKRPEGYKPPPGGTYESGMKELDDKVPGMGKYFDKATPGMHTTDTVDYGVVVRGEMMLELDDGQSCTCGRAIASCRTARAIAGAIRARSRA